MTTNKILQQKQGFTLMETLIAISILLISVVGPMSLIGDSLHKLYFAKDEMLAINLAQEGIEAVRQTRDSNSLARIAWDTGLTQPSYVVDIGGSPRLVACSGCDQKVYFDTTSGLYRQGATLASSTPFTRAITITGLGLGTNERKVTSVVSWKTGGDVGSITVSEYIFNWTL